MAYTKRTTAAAATDDSMALELRRPGSESQDAAIELIAPVAGDLINNLDPAVFDAPAEAAVDEALSTAGVARFIDPAIPSVDQFPADSEYALREMDSLGRMSRGILVEDGTQHMPLARVDELKIAGQGVVVSRPVGSGIRFAVTDGNNRMSDLAIGDDGHFAPHVLEFLAGVLGTGSSTTGGYDVVVTAGQSNSMTGTSYLTVAGIREVDARLFKWTGTQIVPLPADDLSLGAEFAREYAHNHPGRRVLVVFAGVGSIGFTTTSIDPAPEGYRVDTGGTWDRTLTADVQNRYAKMVTLTLGAVAAGGTGSRVAALLWSQGEADGGLTESQYAAKLDDLITTFRTDVSTPSLPAIVGSMTPEMHVDHIGFEQIARALADTPRRVQRVGFVWGPTNGHRYNQTVHYSYAGQIDRAGRMAREGLLEALSNAAANEPVAPLNMRVKRSGGTATVEWDRPLSRVTGLLVEHSTDGTTWSTSTIDTMHGSRATASVAAATAVTFRITVTNTVGSTMPAVVNG